ncbi:hypothetical protein EJB05_35376, partial [Eragrostis curvula]
MGHGWDGIPADVLVAILLRIPLSPRGRLRLVCRHWRDVIDERMPPEPREHAKVLAFFSKPSLSRAFVVDGRPGGRSVEMDLRGIDKSSTRAHMIGTCNGLLCLYHGRPSRITVINPIISTYSFGYHPETGQYKILHVPCHDQSEFTMKLDAVHVFTLRDGGSSWRKVRAPAGSSCHLRFGFVTIDGVTYWAKTNAERIMAFDLKDERVELLECPPVPMMSWREQYSWHQHPHLTDVRGRLGLVVGCGHDSFQRSMNEVWVLEGGREIWTWVKRFTVLAHGVYPQQKISLPHVVHGDHILTTCREGQLLGLSANLPREERKSASCGVKHASWPHTPEIGRLSAMPASDRFGRVATKLAKIRPCLMLRVGAPSPETVVAGVTNGSNVRTFAFIKTREPVLVYGDGVTARTVVTK